MRFSYCLIKAQDMDDLVKKLNSHGQEGYRLVPYTSPLPSDGRVEAIVEKADEGNEPGVPLSIVPLQ